MLRVGPDRGILRRREAAAPPRKLGGGRWPDGGPSSGPGQSDAEPPRPWPDLEAGGQ